MHGNDFNKEFWTQEIVDMFINENRDKSEVDLKLINDLKRDLRKMQIEKQEYVDKVKEIDSKAGAEFN